MREKWIQLELELIIRNIELWIKELEAKSTILYKSCDHVFYKGNTLSSTWFRCQKCGTLLIDENIQGIKDSNQVFNSDLFCNSEFRKQQSIIFANTSELRNFVWEINHNLLKLYTWKE